MLNDTSTFDFDLLSVLKCNRFPSLFWLDHTRIARSSHFEPVEARGLLKACDFAENLDD